MYSGAHATAHAGWDRVTDLDGKYLHYTSGDGGGTGGSATHDHTSPNHTHVDNSHTHTFAASGTVSGTNAPLGKNTPSTMTHTHASTTSNSATSTNQNTAVTINATTNLPSYIDVIFKKSDGTHDIPDSFWAWIDSSSVPTGWGIPNEPKNRYVRGAAADGNGGGTGGATSHTHTAAAHTHTKDTHGHTAKTSATAVGTTSSGGTGIAQAERNHTHNVTLTSMVSTISNTTIDTISTDDDEPVYEKLLIVENQSQAESTPDGIIGIWMEDENDIPAGWERKTITGDFIKCANDATEIGDTGGATTHGHTDTNDDGGHTHTNTAHNHSATQTSASLTVGETVGAQSPASSGHSHSWTIGNATIVTNGAVITVSDCSSKAAYPAYYEIILIKKSASDDACYLPILGAG